MRIVLLGPPGAGKGTHAVMLSKELGLAHISTGNLLRQNVSQGTELGRQAREYMQQGLLVPDELVTRMLAERFRQPDIKAGFILDGYPRTLNQAETLDRILGQLHLPVELALNLTASEAVIIQRLCGRLVCRKCGANFHRTNMPPRQAGICDSCGGELYQREDDREETIRKRLHVYGQEAASLLTFYREQHKLADVSADRSAQEVLAGILGIVRQKNA